MREHDICLAAAAGIACRTDEHMVPDVSIRCDTMLATPSLEVLPKGRQMLPIAHAAAVCAF